MSKLLCKCGHVIVDQTDELPHKGELIRDQDWENVWGAIASQSELDAEALMDFVIGLKIKYTRDVYECQACGRLWVQIEPEENAFRSYMPDPNRDLSSALETATQTDSRESIFSGTAGRIRSANPDRNRPQR